MSGADNAAGHDHDTSVVVALGGEPRRLSPSLEAMDAIDLRFGGFAPAQTQLQLSSTTAIAFVVRVGLGLPEAEHEKVRRWVYAAGALALRGPCIRYTDMLLNGGRLPRDKEAAPQGAPGED